MDKFKDFLVKQNLAKNTISAYLTAVSGFKEHYEEVTKKIGIAREFGDLSENAEYDSAKDEQGKLEAEIAEMETKLKTCVIIDKNKIDTSVVNIGCTVEAYDEDFDEEVEYTIIGSTAFCIRCKISSESSEVEYVVHCFVF